MANFKNITELPLAESAEGLNLIVNDSGSAKQIAASEVGAQADWAETDENSPAFIKNKPVEEWDLDLTVNITRNAETSDFNTPVFTINTGTFENVKNKILNGVPKIKMRINTQGPGGGNITQCSECDAMYAPEGVFVGNPELIGISVFSVLDGSYMVATLSVDNTITLANPIGGE